MERAGAAACDGDRHVPRLTGLPRDGRQASTGGMAAAERADRGRAREVLGPTLPAPGIVGSIPNGCPSAKPWPVAGRTAPNR